MKILRFTIIFFFGFFTAVVVGLWFLYDTPSPPYVSVLIMNETSVPIPTVRLELEDGQIYLLENLPVEASRTVKVFVQSESSYKLKVSLPNGKVLEGGVGYIEPGYKTREKILNDKIQSDEQ